MVGSPVLGGIDESLGMCTRVCGKERGLRVDGSSNITVVMTQFSYGHP